ncbi:hypothetical protein L3Q82_008692, partial [Scortum barcoo]
MQFTLLSLHYITQQLSTVGPRCWRLGRVRTCGRFQGWILYHQRFSGPLEAFTIPPLCCQGDGGGIINKSGARGAACMLGYKLIHTDRLLPSLFPTNAKSLIKKMDEMKLRIVSAKIDSCVAIVIKTCLDNNIPVELAGRFLGQDCSLRETQSLLQFLSASKPPSLCLCLKKSAVTCLNDYRPVALVIMKKCFERIVLKHINRHHPCWSGLISVCIQGEQFSVQHSGSGTSSPTGLRLVRIGDNTSSTLVLSTGTPQGCVLSPALFTLFTSDCSAIHSTNTIVKFADDTTIVGLISDNDETHYREEIQHLTQWCSNNNLVLNTSKTKEVIVDYRRSRKDRARSSPHPRGSSRACVNNIKFLGIHITSDLTWSMNTAHLVKKAQQRLLLPQEAKTCWTLPTVPDKLRKSHNREHPLPQCNSVVWQLHCTRPKGLSPAGENGTVDYGKSPSRPGLSIRWPDPEEGPTYCCRPYPPGQWTVPSGNGMTSLWKA